MAQEGGGELNWQQQELMNKAAPKAGRCDWGDSEAPCDAPRDNQSGGGGGKGGRDNRGGGGRGGGGGGSWGAKEEGIKLYVGNLSWQTTRDDLGEHFASFADVLDVVIVAVVAVPGEQRKKASSCTLEICLGKPRGTISASTLHRLLTSSTSSLWRIVKLAARAASDLSTWTPKKALTRPSLNPTSANSWAGICG